MMTDDALSLADTMIATMGAVALRGVEAAEIVDPRLVKSP